MDVRTLYSTAVPGAAAAFQPPKALSRVGSREPQSRPHSRTPSAPGTRQATPTPGVSHQASGGAAIDPSPAKSVDLGGYGEEDDFLDDVVGDEGESSTVQVTSTREPSAAPTTNMSEDDEDFSSSQLNLGYRDATLEGDLDIVNDALTEIARFFNVSARNPGHETDLTEEVSSVEIGRAHV